MPFLRNAWYAAGWVADFTDSPVSRRYLDEPIVLFRTGDGQLNALGDACPHRFAPLSLGKVSGDTIRCPYHGLVFDKGGSCVHNPHGKGQRPSSLKVRSFPLREENGMVWIWMGDRGAAEGTAPPVYPFLETPGAKTLRGYLYVEANYELVTDNLMDLSHAEFLHPFLGAEGSSAGIVFRAEQDGERVAALHAMPRQPITQLFRLLLGNGIELIDGRADMFWQAPSNLYLETAASALDQASPRSVMLPWVHLLTPETERSTHYFWAVSREVAVDDVELDGMLQAGAAHAFAHEDEPMIRAVQERMRFRPLFELKPALLPMDEAAIRARRVLAKRIELESMVQ